MRYLKNVTSVPIPVIDGPVKLLGGPIAESLGEFVSIALTASSLQCLSVPWASAKDVSQCGEAFLIETERQITLRGLEESATKAISEFSTVIVARGATTGRLTMFGKALAMNQTCYALRSKISVPFSLYCHARVFIEHMVHAAHGSVFDTITTRTFETTRVLLPPVEVQRAFDERVAPLFQAVLTSLHQSRTLAIVRDTLLSGKMPVVNLI